MEPKIGISINSSHQPLLSTSCSLRTRTVMLGITQAKKKRPSMAPRASLKLPTKATSTEAKSNAKPQYQYSDLLALPEKFA